ncbi:Glycosyl hydrolase [Trema orientale]|uniref:galactinol--sucrose galactosyltransferase n=1 Tax=Trema orientale TaxID=63057 RepID=A0A2P5FFX1_TREOI|nr:Glycosyl hydrolase [Trema orientale]
MGAFVRDLKEEFRTVEYVYVWHAFGGYWGGVTPATPGMPESKVVRVKLSKGVEKMMEDQAMGKMVKDGFGFVSPELATELYEGMHSLLESVGIDGVKIDAMHLLELVSEEHGGRVELAKAYYKALTGSIRKHFKGNGVIASMQQCNDFMFLGTEAISLGRVGDDFWCIDPYGDPTGTFWLQGCHMVHCAYNSLWMGNFIHPDWDMFQSTHPCAQFHAASRAISGGPIYVSDSVGEHNFELLKSLALPDGSILRCQYYALPTRDCLFEDPLHDGKTMLKIWNLNKHSGVLGLFNCQGGGWCRLSRRNKCAAQFSCLVTCLASPKDVEWNNGKEENLIPIEEGNLFAVYMFREKKLQLLKFTESVEVSLEPLDFELLTICPVKYLHEKSVQFAEIGLVNMLNTGGAILSVELDVDENLVRIGLRGRGEMKVFASKKPVACNVDGVGVKFGYDNKMVSIQVPSSNSKGESVVEYLF